MTYVGESNNNILLMEPSDFRELFTYNHKVRQNYISTFQRILPWQGMTANHETAWLSLKDTLLHIIWQKIHGLTILFKV